VHDIARMAALLLVLGATNAPAPERNSRERSEAAPELGKESAPKPWRAAASSTPPPPGRQAGTGSGEIHATDAWNVRDYGAQGSGLVNDAPAIQAALDLARDGGTVFLPPGTYDLGTTTLKINGSPRFIGAGMTKSVLRFTGSSAALQVNSGEGRATHSWLISDLGLDGAKAGAIGIRVGQTDRAPLSAGGRIERVLVKGFTKTQIQLVAAQVLSVVASQFSSYNGSGDGLQIAGSRSENTLTFFSACKFIESRRGAVIEQYADLTFRNCQFEQNDEEGLLATKKTDAAVTRHLTIENNYFENNNRQRGTEGRFAQVRITSMARGGHEGVSVSANLFQNAVGPTALALSLGKGNYRIEDNETAGFRQNQFHLEPGVGTLVTGRSTKRPGECWTETEGSQARGTWEATEDGSRFVLDGDRWRRVLELGPETGRRIVVGANEGKSPAWRGEFAERPGSAAEFLRDANGMVHLSGIAWLRSRLKQPTLVFTLPAGYRPNATVMVPATTEAFTGHLTIEPTGEVTILGSQTVPNGSRCPVPLNAHFQASEW